MQVGFRTFDWLWLEEIVCHHFYILVYYNVLQTIGRVLKNKTARRGFIKFLAKFLYVKPLAAPDIYECSAAVN